MTMLLLGGMALLLAQRPADSPRPPAAEARGDSSADPLPPGVVRRLGTGRFRHSGWHKELAFTPDGKMLLTKSESSSLRFWETTTGRRLAELETDDYLLRGFALSDDGKRFVSGGSFKGVDGFPLHGAVRLWDASTRKEIRTIKLGAEDRPELAAI